MVIFCFSIGSEFIEIISTFLSFLGVNYKKIDSNRKIQSMLWHHTNDAGLIKTCGTAVCFTSFQVLFFFLLGIMFLRSTGVVMVRWIVEIGAIEQLPGRKFEG